MDFLTLKVFDRLHNLKITDDEYNGIEQEQKHKERTGIYIAAVKKGVCVCVNHDEKHKIVIQKITPQYTSIDKDDLEYKDVQPKSRILFKTLITFNDIPQEIYVLHQIAQYRSLDTTIKHIANNLEELKDRITDRFADDYSKELGEMYDDVYSHGYHKKKNKDRRPQLVSKQLRAIYWLFNEEYVEEHTETKLNVPTIIKVFSRKNRRVAIIQDIQKWDREIGGYFRRYEHIERVVILVRAFRPNDIRYNYVCPGREFLKVEDKAEIWVDDDLLGKVTASELCVLSNINKVGFVLLTPDKLNKHQRDIRIELMNAKREDEESRAKEILEENIKSQFSKASVVRNGIAYSKKSITYEGIAIKGDRMAEYIVDHNIMLQERPNFNSIFEGYIEYILKIRTVYDYYPYQRTRPEFENVMNLQVGTVKIKIEQMKKCILVNNCRINKEDVETVLKKAIEYQCQDEYDSFLKYTSKVNLRLQKALADGWIKFELEIDRTSDCCLSLNEDKMILAIPIMRKEEKNYVIIKSKEYGVKNVTALFKLAENRYSYHYEGHMQKTIKQLYKSISKITADEISELIDNGRKEYRKMMAKARKEEKRKVEKSMEFVEHAIRISKADKVKGGYLVKGLSNTTYFIGDNLEVWTTKKKGDTYKNDKYLCIVDIGTGDSKWEKFDALAKRLLMLSKDKVIAPELFDAGDHMDKHWLEIQEGCEKEIEA